MHKYVQVTKKSEYCLRCGPDKDSACDHSCMCDTYTSCDIHGATFAKVERKILQIMPADDWWVVMENADGDHIIRQPLIGWALVEEQDETTNVIGLVPGRDSASYLVDSHPCKHLYVKSLRENQQFKIHPAGIREVY